MSLILDFVQFLVYIPFFKPDEEDIARNIRALKKYDWFNAYYAQPEQKALIVHNRHVRAHIGRFKTNKLQNERCQSTYKKKIDRVLAKALQKTA